MVITAYYGLFRIGEIAEGLHVIKFLDVHSTPQRDKILFMLWTSKTHQRSKKPQVVKIMAVQGKNEMWPSDVYAYCPCRLIMQYLKYRPNNCRHGQLFVFRGGKPVKTEHFRPMLHKIITLLSLEAKLYDTHSFRIGRAKDLAKWDGQSQIS